MNELLDWIALRPRSYTETIDAWKSTCPRSTVWEDAVIDGLVEIRRGRVRLSRRGEIARRRGAGVTSADGTPARVGTP